MIVKDGHWYRSREALDRIKALKLTGEPHRTPDGFAVLVLDMRGIVRQPQADGAPRFEMHPPAFVVQAEDGHDLMQVIGRDKIARVEFPCDALGDVIALIEYDHLPQSRRDYKVFHPGTKLA